MREWTTPARFHRVHVRDNHYRYNPERGHWQFLDLTGPWARSGTLEGLSLEAGEAALRSMDFYPLEELAAHG